MMSYQNANQVVDLFDNNLNLNNPIPVRAIYHPAFLLRVANKKRETWEDLKEIQKSLTVTDVDIYNPTYELVKSKIIRYE